MQEGAFRLEKNRIEIENGSLFESQFRHLVETIDASGTRNSLQFSWQTIGLLSHFLADPRPADRTKDASSDDPLVEAAMDYIWSHSHNRIGVPDVARHANVNRRTLERRFLAGTGTTLLNELQRCRLSRAALLLRETDAPVKYIVGRAGFASYQRMRVAFQKHFHLSPERYRRQDGSRITSNTSARCFSASFL